MRKRRAGGGTYIACSSARKYNIMRFEIGTYVCVESNKNTSSSHKRQNLII